MSAAQGKVMDGYHLARGLGQSGWTGFRALFSQLVGRVELRTGFFCGYMRKGGGIIVTRTQIDLGSSPSFVAFSTETSGYFLSLLKPQIIIWKVEKMIVSSQQDSGLIK